MAELMPHGVSPLVVKGAELVRRFYGDSCLALLGDIDLLVRRHELETVKASLHRIGFRQAFFSEKDLRLVDEDIANICKIESTHYELVPFCRVTPLRLTETQIRLAADWERRPLWILDGQAYVALRLTFITVSPPISESAPFFERAVASAFPNAFTLNSGDHLWVTISRYYNEVALHGKHSLRDFAYAAALIDSGPDWDRVLAAQPVQPPPEPVLLPLFSKSTYRRQGS